MLKFICGVTFLLMVLSCNPCFGDVTVSNQLAAVNHDDGIPGASVIISTDDSRVSDLLLVRPEKNSAETLLSFAQGLVFFMLVLCVTVKLFPAR